MQPTSCHGYDSGIRTRSTREVQELIHQTLSDFVRLRQTSSDFVRGCQRTSLVLLMLVLLFGPREAKLQTNPGSQDLGFHNIKEKKTLTDLVWAVRERERERDREREREKERKRERAREGARETDPQKQQCELIAETQAGVPTQTSRTFGKSPRTVCKSPRTVCKQSVDCLQTVRGLLPKVCGLFPKPRGDSWDHRGAFATTRTDLEKLRQ